MSHALLALMGIFSAALPQPATPPGTVAGAPSGGPGTRYCLRVDPIIGTRIETIQCRTRWAWADLGVNVDDEWAENGVRVIG